MLPFLVNQVTDLCKGLIPNNLFDTDYSVEQNDGTEFFSTYSQEYVDKKTHDVEPIDKVEVIIDIVPTDKIGLRIDVNPIEQDGLLSQNKVGSIPTDKVVNVIKTERKRKINSLTSSGLCSNSLIERLPSFEELGIAITENWDGSITVSQQYYFMNHNGKA